MTVPPIVPTPPVRLAPPITTAAIASSSYPSPAYGCAVARREVCTIPANPANAADSTYAPTVSDGTRMPARRATSAFPPMA